MNCTVCSLNILHLNNRILQKPRRAVFSRTISGRVDCQQTPAGSETFCSVVSSKVAAGALAGILMIGCPGFSMTANAESLDFGMAAKGTPEAGGLGIQRGRLLPCPSGTNPNCVSTSSLTPDQYASAWTAPFPNSQEAAVEIASIIQSVLPDTRVKESKLLSNGEYYLQYTTPGPFGTDVVESIGNVKYLYPFQTPITDKQAQRNRMETIRKALGWRLVGCELVECYQ